MTRLVYGGQDLIYPETGKNGKKRKCGILTGLPYLERPLTGRFSEMSQYGWLQDEVLDFSRESENVGSFFGQNKPTKLYPWQLEYKITVSINPDTCSFVLDLDVIRVDDGVDLPAPINPGFQPYFCGDSFNPLRNIILPRLMMK